MKSRRLILLGGFALLVVAALCLATSILTAPEVPPAAEPIARATERPTERKPAPNARLLPTPGATPEGLPASASLGDTAVRTADGMVVLYVPGGAFMLGSDESDPSAEGDELPAHPVTLTSFWIDSTEVTNAQFARCVATGACEPPYPPVLDQHAGYYEDPRYADYPVINVDWEHAWDYCQWAGGRLPHEAQWAYAARGPEGHLYPWGDSPPDDNLLNYGKSLNNTAQVGSYPAGASWCGALDMAGNVWEWTADWYGRYPAELQIDPAGPDRGIGHVLRGGSWYDPASFVRSANRYVVREAYAEYGTPRSYGFGVGFRCVVWAGPDRAESQKE